MANVEMRISVLGVPIKREPISGVRIFEEREVYLATPPPLLFQVEADGNKNLITLKWKVGKNWSETFSEAQVHRQRLKCGTPGVSKSLVRTGEH